MKKTYFVSIISRKVRIDKGTGAIAQRLTEILGRRMTEDGPYEWYFGDAPRFNPEGTYTLQYEDMSGGHFFGLWVYRGVIPYVR